jgi:hypothetical protein
VERFVYKWQIILGGFASASILAVGLAAPALAQTTASSSGLPLSNVAQAAGVSGLSGTAGAACDLQGIPLSGEVSSAAGALGASCSSSGQTSAAQQPASNPFQFSASQNAQPSSQSNSPAGGSTASGLPGLNMVAGVIPGLGSATSGLPLSTVTGGASNSTSSASTSNAPRIGANAIVPSSVTTGTSSNPTSNNDATSNSSVVPGALGGLTGALPAVGSLSGGLPGLGTVTGALSGVNSSGGSTALP